MGSFEQGDVLRVPFPYTDQATRQFRPALVVSSGQIGEDDALVWVMMITSAENRSWDDDIPFGERFAAAGLPAPSVIHPVKLATVEARHAEKIGVADAALTARALAVSRRFTQV